MRERCAGIALIALGSGILISLIFPPWLLLVMLVAILAAVGVCACRR